MSREMKHSGIEWIGEIPKEWEVGSVKHYCNSIFAGGTPQSNNSDYWDGDIPWIPSGSCKNEIIISAPKCITQLGLENSSTKLIPSGTTVMAMTGATCSNVGYVTFDTCMNQSVVAYIENKEKSFSKFLFYLLQGAQEEILTHKTGGAQSGINVEDCKNIIVPLVPLFEQQKIAGYLDKVCGEVDEMVVLQEKMIEELKAYKQSVITEAVTKGLNPNAPMRDSGIDWIGAIPGHWDLARVGLFYFVTKLAGFEYTDTLMNKISSSEVVPIVRAQNVRMYRFEKESITEFIDLETSLLLDRCSLNKKSLLMTFIGAGIGDVCIFDEPKRYHLAPNVAKIEKNSDFDDIICDEYIMYYLGSDAGKGEINKISKASAQASLSMSTIRKISVAIPPIDEQRAIASYLDTKCSEIDSLIALKQAKIEELKEYKKSVIYEYVTGKKEVGG